MALNPEKRNAYPRIAKIIDYCDCIKNKEITRLKVRDTDYSAEKESEKMSILVRSRR